jgi:tRNA(fMet)-specific endonuclease VapC
MATYLLDSNVCIDALRDTNGPVAQNIANHIAAGHSIVTSSIVQYELELGARRSARVEAGLASITRFLSDETVVVDFSSICAQHAAALTRNSQAKGLNLQAFDAWIAGHAIALGATLVTADGKLAEAVSEIEVVSWR